MFYYTNVIHSFLSFILTMMANHHLSLPLFKVWNDFVCSASYSYLVQFFGSNYSWCTCLLPLWSFRSLFAVSPPLFTQSRTKFNSHDNQVGHIRASRPLWSLKEVRRRSHLLFIIVIKMSSHRVYVEPRFACVKNHQGYNFLQGMKFLDWNPTRNGSQRVVAHLTYNFVTKADFDVWRRSTSTDRIVCSEQC